MGWISWGRFPAEAGFQQRKGKIYTQLWIETLLHNRCCREPAFCVIQVRACSWNTSSWEPANSWEPAKVNSMVSKETFPERSTDGRTSDLCSIAPVTLGNVPADEVISLFSGWRHQYPGHWQNCKPAYSSEWMGRTVAFMSMSQKNYEVNGLRFQAL